MTLRETIEKMPKVELHLHLEGAFTLNYLFKLVQKYGGDADIKNIADLEKRFVFRDFPHFIETWFWKNRFFREPTDFEESTYWTLGALAKQNIIYTEAFFSPWDFAESGISAKEIIPATIAGVDRAEKDFNIKCRLIADICRDHGAETSIRRLDDVTPFLNEKIIGIGLGGSEQKFPAYLFKDVFREAKNRGFHIVAHAGEAAGPESIWSAIRDLNVERIGHGFRAVEDPELIEYLQIEQIPLEVCIVSSIKIGVYPSYREYPFTDIFHKGLLVTINSDDPTMFGSTLSDEYEILIRDQGLSLSEIKHVQMNAVSASFASMEEKRKMKDMINSFWDRHNENIQ